MMETVEYTQPKKTARGGSQTMFPGRLHELLEYVESQGLDYIVSWVRNGTAFMVHNQAELLKLLSFFFGQTKYRSFTRQLNMWSFQREEVGPFKGCFSNPYFVKHDKSLCAKMRRHEPKFRATASSQANASKTPKIHASLEGSSIQPFEKMTSLSPSVSTTESDTLSPVTKPDYYPIIDLDSSPMGFKSCHWLNDEEMSSSQLFEQRKSPLKHDQSSHMPCHPLMQAPLSWLSAQSPLSSSEHLNNLDGSLFHLDATDALEPTPILEVSGMPTNGWGDTVEMVGDDIFPIIPQLDELESRFQFPSSSTLSLPIHTQSHQQTWRGEFCSLSQSLDNDDEARYLLQLLQTER